MKTNDIDLFLEVFQDVLFPFLSVDLDKLQAALKAASQSSWRSHCALRIDVSPEKRGAFVSSLRGILRQIDVPPQMASLFAVSVPIFQGGCVQPFLKSLRTQGTFCIAEQGDQLVWEEESLWPIAYSTCLEQFQNIVLLHKVMIEAQVKAKGNALESKGFARENLSIISEYPRQLPTRFHYAAASLGAWVGGATNVQYFSCYAAIRQIFHSPLNLTYFSRIGYDPQVAQKLDASGIIALPASLIAPLLDAQGNGQVLGSIALDESNLANPPAASFFGSKTLESGELLPGFIEDKYYRAPFLARKPGSHAFYGAKDIMRDHYENFYATLTPVAVVRCKHYCVPVVEVRSLEELRTHTAQIPIHDPGGVFFRGQGCLYTLPRDPLVRQLLFGDSCSTEPSLTTSASREKGFDYELLHFALRYFLEQDILKRHESERCELLKRWRAQLVSPDCKLDSAILALAQHYGLPSHGLDVTENDLVAVWFATNRYIRGNEGVNSSYRKLRSEDWAEDPNKWPVVVASQCVTHSIRQSLHDCHELAAFGFEAKRPTAQKARFFQGGHSDHQNRLAEAVVCIFRLAPGAYETLSSFESLFPSPEKDPAYQTMLDFATSPAFGPIWRKYVNRFHNETR